MGEVASVRCAAVDQQCSESDRKVKIDGYMAVSMSQAHHESFIWI